MNLITEFTTVPRLLRNVVNYIHPENNTFLLQKVKDNWEEISYKEVLHKADAVSAYFLEMGIQKGDRCALMIENSPEYVYYDQGLQQVGAVNVSIYPTLSESEVEYILRDSGARTLLIGNPFLFRKVLKMGRTQLQDAVPMSLGQEFHAFATLLKEDSRLLKTVQKLILEVNLGATAIGTGVNAPEGYSTLAVKKLSEVTGYPFVISEDLIEATSDCGAYIIISGALKRTAVKLSKICNDLRLLSSGPRAGLKEINLPELQAGSSIMPAKVNPVIPEVVNQVAFKVIGNDLAVTLAAEAGQLQLNVMEPVIASSMFESISLLTQACYTLKNKCIDGITANPERTKEYVMNSIGIVTYLDPIIGHAEGDLIGKICAQTGKSVAEVALERGVVTQAQLDEIFSVENLLNPKYLGKKH